MIALVVDVWQRTSWDEAVIGGAAFLSASAVVYRKAIVPMVRAFTAGAKAWEWIELQMKPNGGESLRDKIDQMVEVLKVIPEIVDRLERVEAAVTDLQNERTQQ